MLRNIIYLGIFTFFIGVSTANANSFCYGLDADSSIARDKFEENCPGQERVDCSPYHGEIMCATVEVTDDLIISEDTTSEDTSEEDPNNDDIDLGYGQEEGVACEVNETSLNDRLVDHSKNDFSDFKTAAITIPSISYAEADADDTVVRRYDLIEPQELKIVVRKPTPQQSKTLYISNVPEDPQEARIYIMEKFEEAVELNSSEVKFPANSCIKLENPLDTGVHLELEGLHDVTIDFNGSTLEYMKPANGIVIKDSSRVLFKNGNFKTTLLISSIARVDASSSSATGLQFTILPEFVEPLEAAFPEGVKPALITAGRAKKVGSRYVIDAKDNADIFINRGKSTNNYTYQYAKEGDPAHYRAISEADSKLGYYKAGDLVYLLHFNNSGHGFTLKNSDGDVEDISFENITLMNIAGMGIAGEVNRGVHLNNVKIIPDPENPFSIWGSSSDAFHINNNSGDIIVENSEFEGSADDLFTTKGNWWKVAEIDYENKTIVVDNVESKRYGVHLWARPNDNLVILDHEFNVLGTAKSSAFSEKGSGKKHIIHLQTIPSSLQVGSLVSNPDLAGGRILISGNTYKNTRAQGVLIQTAHAIVENNYFENIAGPAVKFNITLADWYEGVNTGNALIKNNLFKDTAVGATKPPYSIYFHQINRIDNVETELDVIDNVMILYNNFDDDSYMGNCY